MAKSLRSKRQQQNKRIKRATGFGDVANARQLRLAEKLHGASSEQLEALRKKVDAARGVEVMEDDAEEKQPEQEQEEPKEKKISTSGWNKKRKHQGNSRTKRRFKR